MLKHYWAEPGGAEAGRSFLLFHTAAAPDALYNMHVTAHLDLAHSTLWQPPLEAIVDISQLNGERGRLVQVDANMEKH